METIEIASKQANPFVKTELIYNVLAMVLKIQNEGKHAVFFRLSGHTNGLDIDIHKNGWDNNSSSDFTATFYTDGSSWEHYNTLQMSRLKNFIATL